MNSTQNQLQFYRLCLVIAQNSGQLERDSDGISSSIAKLYGELTGVSKGTGTILNIAKMACGLGRYVNMDLETKEKIEYLLQCFDDAEKMVQPIHVKKYAKRKFEAKFPEYSGRKFSYFQHVWNIWIEKYPKRKDVYCGGVLEDIDQRLSLEVDVTESRKLRDLPLEV